MKHKHAMRDLPKIRDSLSFLYFEYGHLEQSKLGVEFVNKLGHIPLPVASLSALLLGPGTTVTHGAVRTLVEAGCSFDGTVVLLWRTNNEQGFEMRSWQSKQYVPINVEGIWLTLRPAPGATLDEG